MARYFLTGAAGFIGWNVARQLLKESHEVVAVDNMNDAYDVRLKNWRLKQLMGISNFTFTQADISDESSLASAWGNQSFDAVINLAARAGVRQSVRDPLIYYQTNVLGTLHLLNACRDRHIPKFVQASTSSLYGCHTPRPFREEADISRPLSPYAASKGASELLCHSYHHLYSLDVSILRYFTVYGPAGRPDMSIFRFIQWIAEGRPVRIYGDGHQERDFTFVDDIARGTISALRPMGFEVINLGGDHPLEMLDVLHKIEKLLQCDAKIEWHDPAPADIPATWAHIEKAGRLLGWEPQMSLEDGLAACVSWYQQERNWAKQVATLAE
jgi:UDP-glucuronate 4-epimerase